MQIHELVSHQRQWEGNRGIKNPNHNLDRTQLELDEAKEEMDPMKRLVEMVDVLIILSGGMARLCDDLGVKEDTIDDIIRLKLDLNDKKYEQETFDSHSVETAVSRSRHYFKHPDQFAPNDYY